MFSWFNAKAGHPAHVILSLAMITLLSPLLCNVIGINKWISIAISLLVSVAVGTGREIIQAMRKDKEKYMIFSWTMYFDCRDMKANSIGWVVGTIFVSIFL